MQVVKDKKVVVDNMVSASALERYFEYLRIQNKGKFRAEVCTPDEYLVRGRKRTKVKKGVCSKDIGDVVFSDYYKFLDEINKKLSPYNCGLKSKVTYADSNLDVTGVEVKVDFELNQDIVDIKYLDFLKVKAILEDYVSGARFWTY
jgi:hypothetical protein